MREMHGERREEAEESEEGIQEGMNEWTNERTKEGMNERKKQIKKLGKWWREIFFPFYNLFIFNWDLDGLSYGHSSKW